jgi:glutathione synthase/RimK-type ligase-like ATP-grasp enzyme
VGQKYLLEAIKAPLVKTYIFYSKKEALEWASSTSYPKVFKLRTGAASSNVRLVRNYRQAKRLVKKAFSTGFKKINRSAYLNDRLKLFIKDKNYRNLWCIVVQIVRFFIPNENEKISTREKGYIYFQDFIPDNKYDTRLFVIGNRCFGMRRFNRKNDFRASGSDLFSFNRDLIDYACIKQSFQLAKKLKTQSLALDLIKQDNDYKLIEISYCFPSYKLDDAPGFWDAHLVWHDVKVNAEYSIIEDFIASIMDYNYSY